MQTVRAFKLRLIRKHLWCRWIRWMVCVRWPIAKLHKDKPHGPFGSIKKHVRHYIWAENHRKPLQQMVHNMCLSVNGCPANSPPRCWWISCPGHCIPCKFPKTTSHFRRSQINNGATASTKIDVASSAILDPLAFWQEKFCIPAEKCCISPCKCLSFLLTRGPCLSNSMLELQ